MRTYSNSIPSPSSYVIASLGRSTVHCPIDGLEIRTLFRLKYDSLLLQFVYARGSLCRDVVLI